MDISKCLNETCPLRSNCLRFMGSSSYWQSYSMFTLNKDGTCDDQIEMKKKEDECCNCNCDDCMDDEDINKEIFEALDEIRKANSKKRKAKREGRFKLVPIKKVVKKIKKSKKIKKA